MSLDRVPTRDGTCHDCGCAAESHDAGSRLFGVILFVAVLAALVGFALVVRGAVVHHDAEVRGESK